MKIESCPFCGGEVKIYDEPVDAKTTTYHFVCDNCDMTAYFDYLNKEESIEAWNTRKPMPKIIEQLELLREGAGWDEAVAQDDRHIEIAANRMDAFGRAIEKVKKGGV